MEGSSGLQIGWAGNVAGATLSLCGADCGLVGLMGCSAGGTWVCCIQGAGAVSLPFLAQSPTSETCWTQAGSAQSRLGSLWWHVCSTRSAYTHDMQRSKWLRKGPEGLLTWAGFHFVELQTDPAESFKCLGPASCQRRGWPIHLRAGPAWTRAWVWFDTNARSPGGCAGEERGVWNQPGSSRAKMEQKLASLSLPDPRVYGVTLPRVPHSICFSSFRYPALLMNTSLPQIMVMWPCGCVWSWCMRCLEKDTVHSQF